MSAGQENHHQAYAFERIKIKFVSRFYRNISQLLVDSEFVRMVHVLSWFLACPFLIFLICMNRGPICTHWVLLLYIVNELIKWTSRISVLYFQEAPLSSNSGNLVVTLSIGVLVAFLHGRSNPNSFPLLNQTWLLKSIPSLPNLLPLFPHLLLHPANTT